ARSGGWRPARRRGLVAPRARLATAGRRRTDRTVRASRPRPGPGARTRGRRASGSPRWTVDALEASVRGAGSGGGAGSDGDIQRLIDRRRRDRGDRVEELEIGRG